jgi:deoxyribose-phosphate aldolase
VDFLKTSTGKTAHSASLEAARLMLECIAMQPRAVGFKASGGIRTVADATDYIALVRQTLGADATTPQRLRFGASGLLGDIERVLSGGVSGAAPASAY